MRRTRALWVVGLVALGSAACGGGAGPGDVDGGGDISPDAPVDVGGDAPADTVADTAADTVADTTPDGGPDVPVTQPNVVLNEIVAANGADDWVELANPGDASVPLAGWTLTDSNPTNIFVFPVEASIGPLSHLLIPRNPDTGFDFGLSPADSVSLFDSTGALVDRAVWPVGVTYDGNSWGRMPDMTGEFQVLVDPTPGLANRANTPAVCGQAGREPGEVCDGADLGDRDCSFLGLGAGTLACASGCDALDAAACGAGPTGVLINEVSSDGDDPIELHNPTGAAVDLGGWSLSDLDVGVYLIPTGISLAPGAYLVLRAATDAPVPHELALGDADGLVLRDAGGVERDRVSWLPFDAYVSYCRAPDATGSFARCATPSFGAANP